MQYPVLLPNILSKPLTYESNLKDLSPGDIVVVPLGKKKRELGVIWDKLEITSKKFKVKKILNKFHNLKIKKELIQFVNWFATYNLCPRGMVIKMILANFSLDELDRKEEKPKPLKINLKNFELNAIQKKNLLVLRNKNKKFEVFVIDGITGSGKTLIYFERIKDIIQDKKQTLLLLPEIFLTNQFITRFREYFGFEPDLWHSKITKKTKHKIWKNVLNGTSKVVIGARSALFLPFKNLGLIVVDEEHDTSYKQEEGIIFNARDMAITRAKYEGVQVYLVSATPSLETYYNIKKKKFHHLKLEKRFNNNLLPQTKIVDLNSSSFKKNKILADETIAMIEEYLAENNQVLFFLNKRGYAPIVICKKCKKIIHCPNCTVYLSSHKTISKLLCHHCGYTVHNKTIKCCEKNMNTENNNEFIEYGIGVEKLEEIIKNLFPQKRIITLSSDLIKQKKQKDLLLKLESGFYDIIIATQIIAKGFNFPKLNCIVVPDIDFSKAGYDLRSNEKNMQLYTQLVGRAGRYSKKSSIIFQTFFPQNKTLEFLANHQMQQFSDNEMTVREKNILPPFSRLISCIISSSNQSLCNDGAMQLKKKFLELKNCKVLGPVQSPIFKLRNQYRSRLLLKFNSDNFIQKELMILMKNLNISKQIKLTVDVDPINFT